MNSQTLRIMTEKNITDFNINDGKTASHFLDILSTRHLADCLEKISKKYDSIIISSENDPMSWGTEKDKMTDIRYIDVDSHKKEFIDDEILQSSLCELKSSRIEQKYGPKTLVVGTPSQKHNIFNFFLNPSKPRVWHFSESEENKINFKKMWGK